MNALEKVEIRISKIKQELATLARTSGTLDEEQSKRFDSLEKELGSCERKKRALLITSEPAGEPAAKQALESRARLYRYVNAALTGTGLTGAERELAKEQGMPDSGHWVPVEAFFEGPNEQQQGPETRADAHTAAPTTVSRGGPGIMGRLFPGSIMNTLGVSMPRVPVGERVYTILTAGTSAASRSPGASIDSSAATFSTTELKPVRLAARYTFTLESSAQLAGMERALRTDLLAAMAHKQAQDILYGSGTTPAIGGFLSSTTDVGLPAVTGAFNKASAVITWADTVGLLGALDGLHAQAFSDVRYLFGPASAIKMAALFQNNTATSAWDYLGARAGTVRVSSHIAEPVSNVQGGLLYRSRGAGGIKAVAPMWGGVELIRDPYTDSASGVRALTVHALWNFAILRADAYSRISLKLA